MPLPSQYILHFLSMGTEKRKFQLIVLVKVTSRYFLTGRCHSSKFDSHENKSQKNSSNHSCQILWAKKRYWYPIMRPFYKIYQFKIHVYFTAWLCEDKPPYQLQISALNKHKPCEDIKRNIISRSNWYQLQTIISSFIVFFFSLLCRSKHVLLSLKFWRWHCTFIKLIKRIFSNNDIMIIITKIFIIRYHGNNDVFVYFLSIIADCIQPHHTCKNKASF